MSENPSCYLALCGIVKNETPFLREWVAYHHLIGFERIFLYDNGSDIPVSETLKDMSDAGMVEIFSIEGEMMQLVAYNHCLRHHGPQCRWIAFFDMDEFLLLKESGDARAFVAEYEAYGGVALNNNVIGSSGHLARPDGLVIENYLDSIGAVTVLKCIVQPQYVKMPFTPHNFVHTDGQITVNTDGMPVFGAYAPLALERAELFHYYYRSQQDHEEKLRRGDAFRPFSIRQLTGFYIMTKKPWFHREDMLPYVERVKSIIENNAPDSYHPVDACTLQQEPYRLALVRLGEATEQAEQAETAEKGESASLAQLIFALNHARFHDKAPYLALGIQACRLARDYRRARRAAMDLIRLLPQPSSYYALLVVEAESENHKAFQSLASFMVESAGYHEDKETIEKVRHLANMHGLPCPG